MSFSGVAASSRRSGVWLASCVSASRPTAAEISARDVAHRRDHLRAHAERGAELEFFRRLIEDVDRARLGAGNLHRRGDDRDEHGPQIERRVDRLGDLAERAQLLDRARKLRRAGAQFAEQPRVLDGDDGLVGEILHQRDLLVGKRPDFLPVDDDAADQYIVLEHRHAKRGTRAAKLNDHGVCSAAVFCADVPLGHLLCLQQVAVNGIRGRPEGSAFAEELVKCGRHAKRSSLYVEQTVLIEEQKPKLRLADPDCVFHDRVEHRL